MVGANLVFAHNGEQCVIMPAQPRLRSLNAWMVYYKWVPNPVNTRIQTMLTRFANVPTTDPLLQTRGQLLKGTAVLVFITALAYLPFLTDNGLTFYLLAGGLLLMALLACVAFVLVYYNFVVLGGLLLSTAITAFLSMTPEYVVSGSSGVAYVIAALIAGFVAGAHAALVFGGLGIGILVLLTTVGGSTWTDSTTVNVFTIAIITALVWLMLRALEGALHKAHQQTSTVLAAQETIVAREQALAQTNQNLLMSNQQMEALFATVRDLETPVIPLLAGVMLVPLVGQLDSARIERITIVVLEAVYTQRTQTVIIDITGVAVMDEALAANLVRLAQAVQLLGAHIMLTGISAGVAQTLVATDIALGDIQTTGRLQDGLALVITNAQSL